MIPAPLVVVVILALAVGWEFLVARLSGRRRGNPLWTAFSMTLVAVIYVVAGAAGYILERHARSVARTAWAGHVLWSEIAMGCVVGLLASLFWRKGLQNL